MGAGVRPGAVGAGEQLCGRQPAWRARYRRIRSAAVGSGMGISFRHELQHGPPLPGALSLPAHLANGASGGGWPAFGRVGDLVSAIGACRDGWVRHVIY
jgi:hypothetical protein